MIPEQWAQIQEQKLLIENGIAQFEANMPALEEAERDLKTGEEELNAEEIKAKQKIAEAYQEIAKGWKEIEQGEAELEQGAIELADGERELEENIELLELLETENDQGLYNEVEKTTSSLSDCFMLLTIPFSRKQRSSSGQP